MAAATDDFGFLQPGLEGPLVHLANVTPDDANDLAHESRALFIGVAGALKVTTAGGEILVIPAGVLAVGVPHPLRVTRIWSTGTTASSIATGW